MENENNEIDENVVADETAENEKQNVEVAVKNDSPREIPLIGFILLIIVSCDLYKYYWFYRNWKDIKNSFEDCSKINVWLRTVGFFVPILDVYLLYKQFNIVQEKSSNCNVKTYRLISLLTIIAVMAINYVSFAFKGVATTFWTLEIFPLMFMQNKINDLWNEKNPSEEKFKLRTPEIIFMIVGVFLWITQILYSMN